MKKFSIFLLCAVIIALSCMALLVGCDTPDTTKNKLEDSPLIGNWICVAPFDATEKENFWEIKYDPNFSKNSLKCSSMECSIKN